MVDGCGTRLSAYNPSSVCALHGGSWQEEYHRTTRKVAQREEITRHCAFEQCGREFATTNPAKKYWRRRLPHEGLPGSCDGSQARRRRRRRGTPRQLTPS